MKVFAGLLIVALIVGIIVFLIKEKVFFVVFGFLLLIAMAIITIMLVED